jgi:hypothetical protein
MKHYVILCDWAVDNMGERGVNISSISHTLEEAKETFARVTFDEKQYAEEHGWVIYANTDTEFDAGEEGNYDAEHTHFYIEEVE